MLTIRSSHNETAAGSDRGSVGTVIAAILGRDVRGDLPFDPAIPEPRHHVVADLLAEVRRSRPTVERVAELPAAEVAALAQHAPPGMSTAVTRLDLRGRTGVDGQMWVSTSERGLLSGVRIEVARPAPVTSADDLVGALGGLDAEPAVYVRPARSGRSSAPAVDVGRIKDVASLAKVTVLVGLLDAVAAGRLNLADRIRVDAADICALSAGLTAEHAGRPISLGDLAVLMMLRSDNTASDILLDEVGPPCIAGSLSALAGHPVDAPMPMSALIEQAWGIVSGVDVDHDVDLPPVHARGLGHFMPLRLIAAAFDRLTSSAWVPWPPPPDQQLPATWYKGGYAPGTLAGMWYLPESGVTVGAAVNSPTTYGALEDLFFRHCAEGLALHLASLDAVDERSPG